MFSENEKGGGGYKHQENEETEGHYAAGIGRRNRCKTGECQPVGNRNVSAEHEAVGTHGEGTELLCGRVGYS